MPKNAFPASRRVLKIPLDLIFKMEAFSFTPSQQLLQAPDSQLLFTSRAQQPRCLLDSVSCWVWSLPWDSNSLLPPILLTSHSSPRGQRGLLRIMFLVSSRDSAFTQEGKATKVWKCSKICKWEEDWETVFIFPAGMCLKVKAPQLAEFF